MSETNDNLNAYRLRELTAGLDRLAGLARQIKIDPNTQEGSPEYAEDLLGAWALAPLNLRLKFVRELLPEQCSLLPALRQAIALSEMYQNGLEAWALQYPALFTDAVQLLYTGIYGKDGRQEPESAITLSLHILQEAFAELGTEISRFNMEWIVPEPGSALTADHEVVGEAPSSELKGKLATIVRVGLRRQGKLLLPAQVMRSSGPEQLTGTIPANDSDPHTEDALEKKLQPAALEVPSPEETVFDASPHIIREAQPELPAAQQITEPDWLRILRQRLHGCVEPEVELRIRQLQALVEIQQRSYLNSTDSAVRQEMSDLLESLLPILSMRYADRLPGVSERWGQPLLEARDAILEWLRDTLTIETIVPERADRFESTRMQASETRRTVHSTEVETVARVERIGITWYNSVLIRAQVVKYELGRD